MDEVMSDSFAKDRDITDLMELLKKFHDKDGMEKLNHTVEYVDSLEQTLSAMMEQLTDMMEELQSVREQNDYLMTRAKRTIKNVLIEQAAKAEEKVQELHGKLVEIRASIKQNAHELVEKAKHQGRKALKKLSEVLHIREGLEKIKGHADQMLDSLDELSNRINGYNEQMMMQSDKKAASESEVAKSAVDKENAQPLGTYEEEMQRFTDSCVAEGREYGSNAEAFEAFKNYYDKRTRVAGQAGEIGRDVVSMDKDGKQR
ncbi:hypothetical protein E5357_07670 [Hominisplanchenecus murintestinalis]|uniref:Uncharacterized protein n=1 Tax=Hominisplanchenecus murintestinalis TaxID=2941517 RepID=A0AC61R1C4_9FIRM|nr:DUF6674 family protein [Hominisplanchenecus murintestinalis]TGX98833.1 hypothetical protein E5357_07670 [Hominisplanchenecus murintestinalis]